MTALNANKKESELSKEEHILKYFEALYGDNPITTVERLKFAKEMAQRHSTTKKFVLKIISPQ